MAKDKKFEYFPVDTADPLMKYKQPQPNDVDLTFKTPWGAGSGYPQTDIDRQGTKIKGQYPPGSKTKTREVIQGYGAATKGKMFHPDD